MYVKGVGMTKFGFENRATWDMAYEASLEALEGSNLSVNDIDAAVISTVDTLVSDERQRHYPSLVSSLFKRRIPMIQMPAVCGGGGAAFWAANKLGYDNVLVLGVDKIAVNTSPVITNEIMNATDKVWEQNEGMIFPCSVALVAQQHMLKYGTTTDDLDLVAFKNHENAFLNEKTPFYRKKITLEQIKKSPVIASPFRLYDCTLNVNGAAAAVLSREKSDVEVAGSSLHVDHLGPFEREDMTTLTACGIAAKEAYKKAGISAEDIDVMEVHDAFTILELLSYEDMGFCKKGEGTKLIRNGTTKINGKLPVNPSGGLKARGHPISATGMAQIYEIVRQLRGECGDRQVSKHKYGLTQNIGGPGGSVIVNIFKKMGG